MKTLRREYRVRFVITLLFFVSCSVVVGIGALTPAFIFSYSQEKEALEKVKVLQKSREESGMEDISKELDRTGVYIKKLQSASSSPDFSPIISQIIGHKNPGISITSFKFSPDIIYLGGKAATREGLVEFKKRLESDPGITSVELPVSDLAKSRDITFSLKLSPIAPK